MQEYMDLVLRASELAWDSNADTISEKHVESVLGERRRQIELGLTTAEVGMLAVYLTDRTVGYNSVVDEFLRRRLMFSYSGEPDWYFPHPLLLLGRLRPGEGRTS